jgi:hypothetical protein
VARPIRWVPALDTLRIEERAGLRVPAIQPCSYVERTNGRQPRAPVRRRIRYTRFDGTRWSARVHADGSVGPIQFQSAGLNLVLLTPLWTRTAHVVPLRMVRCRFPKLRYG